MDSSTGCTRAVVISDTHNTYIPVEELPHGDLLIHCGDHTRNGTKPQLEEAAQWLQAVAERFPLGVVHCAGNHDKPLDAESWLPMTEQGPDAEGYQWTPRAVDAVRGLFHCPASNVEMLEESSCIKGSLQIYGAPLTPMTAKRLALSPDDPRRTVGFKRDAAALAAAWASIPASVDVLITHGPPQGVLDLSVQHGGLPLPEPLSIGDVELIKGLRAMSKEERPLIHVFGHEHDNGGQVRWDAELEMWFANCAVMDPISSRKNGHHLRSGLAVIVITFEPHLDGRQRVKSVTAERLLPAPERVGAKL